MGITFGSQPYAHTNGLVLNLDATNQKSYAGTGTTWTDVSPSGINGTINGSPTFTNRYFVFNGSTNSVSLGNLPLASPLSLTSNFSLEFVFTPTAYQSTTYFGLTNVLFEKGTASTYNYEVQATSDTTVSFVKRSGTEGLQFHTFTVPSMQFKLNVLTFVITSNTTITCYMNNQLIGSTAIVGAAIEAVNNDPAGISLIDVAGATRFIGKFYSVRAYNKVLTTTNILQNYLYITNRLGV
jgi:hypothetical protein